MKSLTEKDLNSLNKILFYGFGNPGRKDDGLGILFVDKLEKWVKEQSIDHVDFDSNYQLNIEDAYTISKYDLVIFVDASMEDIGNFTLSRVKPSDKVNFSTHSVSPAFVAQLCGEIYAETPDIYLIHIKGYKWNLEEGLSSKAKNNLRQSLLFAQLLLEKMANKSKKNYRQNESIT